MTRMKSKWLVLFIVFGLILTACGGSDTAEEVETVAEEAPAEELDSPATTAAPTTTTGPTAEVCMVYDIGGRGDLSFNDMAYAGLEKAVAELGVNGQES